MAANTTAISHGNGTMASPSRVRLHCDIMALVSSFLSHRDLNSVAKTCHDLRRLICPIIASRFETSSPSSLLLPGPRFLSYLQYMINEFTTRSRWLRHLSFSTAALTLENTSLLSVLLQSAVNLESIAIYDFGFRLERIPVDILKPLCEGHPCLRSLAFADVGPKLHDILQRIDAPVRHISLRYDIDFFDPNPFDSIAGMRNKDLTSVVFCRTSYDRRDISEEWDTRTWPSVRELTLECTYDFTLEPLYRGFPNLRSLIRRDDIYIHDHIIDVVRRNNESLGEQWAMLDYVRMDVNSLWLMAIGCPIRTVDTSFTNPQHLDRLVDSLKRARPTTLHLRLGDLTCDAQTLAVIYDATPNLECLELSLSFGAIIRANPSPLLPHIKQIEDAISTSLPRLKALRYLHLHPIGNALSSSVKANSTLLSGDEHALQHFVEHATGTTKSLEYVFVHDCNRSFPYGWEFGQHEVQPNIYQSLLRPMSDDWARYRARESSVVLV